MPNQPNEQTNIPASADQASAAPKLSPEMQNKFDIFLINGMEIVYDQKTTKAMLTRIGKNPDPQQAIADILVDIVMNLVSSAKEAGQAMPPEIVMHGSNMLLGELFRVFDAAGMEPLTEEQKAGIWQLAVSKYLDLAVKSGQMTQQELTALSDQAKQTEAGQAVMTTAKNPQAAMSGGAQAQSPVAQNPDPQQALAAPRPGGI